MRRRRRFSAEFKEVALEAIKGHETVAERLSVVRDFETGGILI
jgi:transposase-like protein